MVVCTFAINWRYLIIFMTYFTNYCHLFDVFQIGKGNTVHFSHIIGKLWLLKLAKLVKLWINILIPVLKKKFHKCQEMCMDMDSDFILVTKCILLRRTGSYTVSNLRSKTNSKLGQYRYIYRTCIKATPWSREGE